MVDMAGDGTPGVRGVPARAGEVLLLLLERRYDGTAEGIASGASRGFSSATTLLPPLELTLPPLVRCPDCPVRGVDVDGLMLTIGLVRALFFALWV